MRRVGESEEETTEERFTIADAKTAGLWSKGGTWKTHPKRMLKYKARAFALRDKFPDALNGMHMKEEIQPEEMKNITPMQEPRATPFDRFKDGDSLTPPPEVTPPKPEVTPPDGAYKDEDFATSQPPVAPPETKPETEGKSMPTIIASFKKLFRRKKTAAQKAADRYADRAVVYHGTDWEKEREYAEKFIKQLQRKKTHD